MSAYRIVRILTGLCRLLTWIFVVTSMILVGWGLLSCMRGGSSTFRIMATEGGGHDRNAVGLTYVGWSGALLSLAQMTVVVWAMWASRNRKVVFRSIGHLILIAWAGLWTANAFHVFGDGEYGLVHVLPVFFVSMCIGAILDL